VKWQFTDQTQTEVPIGAVVYGARRMNDEEKDRVITLVASLFIIGVIVWSLLVAV
jgi:hypothetical protein